MNQFTTAPAVCFGEILWDVIGNDEFPGGAPMNVAYHLHKAGVPATVATRVGNDTRGARLLERVKAGIGDIPFIQTDELNSTGVVFAKRDVSGDMTYDIVRPAAWDHIQFDLELMKLLETARFFIFGSLITRSVTSRDTLYRYLQAAATKVFDLNLRTPYYERAGIEQLLNIADIIKMNEEELSWLTEAVPDKDISARLRYLQDKFGTRTIMVTRGEKGAVLLQDDSIYEHPGYSVNVEDTVGSGDAFLAGYLVRTLQGASTEKALSYACALGALTASKKGGWPDYSQQELEVLQTSQSKHLI